MFNERGCVAKIGDCGAGDDGNRISWRMLLVTDKDCSKTSVNLFCDDNFFSYIVNLTALILSTFLVRIRDFWSS